MRTAHSHEPSRAMVVSDVQCEVEETSVQAGEVLAPEPYEAGTMPSAATVLMPGAAASAMATVTLQGTIWGTFWPEEHTDPVTTEGYPIKYLRLYDELGHELAAFYTNGDGTFSKTYSLAPGIYLLNIPLQSSWVRPRRGSQNGSTPSVTRTLNVNGSGTITVNHTWAASDESNVLRHAHQMASFFLRAPFSYTGIAYLMTAAYDVEASFGADASGTYIRFEDTAYLNRPFARTAEVVRHEYTHNTIYAVYGDFICNGCGTIDGESEVRRRAMDEGISDYFAATVSGDPLIGETLPIETRDLDNNTFKWTRNPTRNDLEWAYWNSQVISGALWDARQAVTNTNKKTDQIVFRALRITPHARTFEDFGYNMLLADHEYNGGANQSKIRTAFQNHGITIPSLPPPPSTPTNLTITNDGAGGQNPRLTWSPSSGATRYDVYRCLDNPLISTDCNSTSNFTKIGTSGGLTSYTDYGVQMSSSCASGGTYYKAAKYFVKAANTVGESGASNQDATCSNQAANKQDVAALAAGTQELLPSEYALEAAYPNPFNPTTEIRFALPEAADVRLVVYDALGREVARLVDGPVAAGYQHATFEASGLPSGVYLYRLEAQGSAETFSKTGRMVLVK